MRKNTKFLVALFSLLVFSGAASAQIVIDDFTDGNTLSTGPGAPVSHTTNGPGILGGQRVDTLELPSGALALVQFNGGFNVGVGAPGDAPIGSLFYDSLSGTDLTDGGALTAFQLSFTSTDSTCGSETQLESS